MTRAQWLVFLAFTVPIFVTLAIAELSHVRARRDRKRGSR
jgi:hypothetical protein